MTNMKRRVFLKGILTTGGAVCAGMLIPQVVLASWPTTAFNAGSVDQTLKDLFAGESITESAKISFPELPTLAQDARSVPVNISTTLPKVSQITLLVDKNPRPLAATYLLSDRVEPKLSMRVKMAKTTNVVAVVKSNGKLYSARKKVKITIGGCGG
ncbi:sulfur oxidation protein SoxY [bacterium BMS3Abin12]|nr:sulfur oxidation protein SoxY [bacterium BMS3Abin12]GBE49238.1 sulfur oxidation protein SoxY [bacterium BMS3Bbin13]